MQTAVPMQTFPMQDQMFVQQQPGTVPYEQQALQQPAVPYQEQPVPVHDQQPFQA